MNMKMALRTIAALIVLGSVGALLSLVGVLRQSSASSTMSAFAAFLLVLALLQLVGGVALWQLRGWGRIMVAALVALAIFMAGYIGINAGWSMLVVMGILLQLAMLITLLSQGARNLCRGGV